MKRIIPVQKTPIFNNSIEKLLESTKTWTSEIDFIFDEQIFLKELLSEHIMGLCVTHNFQLAKLLLKGIEHENKLGKELLNSIREHTVNLTLLVENIYLNKEVNFREYHEELRMEVKNYVENFKYLKKQVFKLVLFIMKKDKQQRLLSS
jgi:aspartokinase